MNEETDYLPSKTWIRSVEPVIKDGYKEGAADGQTDSFQSSFDVGYEQGLKFGLQIGFKQGLVSAVYQANNPSLTIENLRRIQCQLCIDGTEMQQKVDNIFNKQEELNDNFLQVSGSLLQCKKPGP